MKINSNDSLVYQASEDLHVFGWDIRTPTSFSSSSGNSSSSTTTGTTTTTTTSSSASIVLGGLVYFPTSMDVEIGGNLVVVGCKGFDSIGCDVKIYDIRMPN